MERDGRLFPPSPEADTLGRTRPWRKGIVTASLICGGRCAVRHAVFIVDLVGYCGPVVGDALSGVRTGRGGVQRTRIAAEPATGIELQQHQTPDLPIPRRGTRALVLPVDVSLYATPDMESRVVIR